MKNRYVTIKDIEKEIVESDSFIDSFNKEIEFYKERIKNEKQRIVYFDAVLSYLREEGLCPFTSKQILTDDTVLQDFAMPLVVRDKMKKWQLNFVNHKGNGIVYDLSSTSIGQILSDFVDFVNNMKGHRVGIGDLHIQKFLDENTFVRCK